MTNALVSAVARAEKLPPEEQDVLAAILLEEIASEDRWSQSFARSGPVLEALAAEALAEFKSGQTFQPEWLRSMQTVQRHIGQPTQNSVLYGGDLTAARSDAHVVGWRDVVLAG